MPSTRGRLQEAVADAISAQLADEIDESDLPRDVAVRLTAERLVQEALAKGHAGEADIADVHGFAAGNTALMVARVNARISYVVKVDTSPDLVREAHLLQRMTTDPMLPASTRAAFPRVFAIDEVGPIYGYLMEDLEDFTPLHLAVRETHPESAELVCGFWTSILEPAYRASLRSRLAHDLWDDYFGRALDRLEKASQAGALPARDQALMVSVDGTRTAFERGWAHEIQQARHVLNSVAPGFGTWVHGDPNPENAMWRSGLQGPVFRILDPKDWWTGDYLFDAAKLGHYLVVTSPIESGSGHGIVTRQPDCIEISEPATTRGRALEARLLTHIEAFATETGDQHWRARYDLAFAANLLSIAGPRAERALATNDAIQRDLADAALALGLVTLRKSAAVSLPGQSTGADGRAR